MRVFDIGFQITINDCAFDTKFKDFVPCRIRKRVKYTFVLDPFDSRRIGMSRCVSSSIVFGNERRNECCEFEIVISKLLSRRLCTSHFDDEKERGKYERKRKSLSRNGRPIPGMINKARVSE